MLSASRTLQPRYHRCLRSSLCLHLSSATTVRAMSSSSAAATSTSASSSPSFQLLPGKTRIGWIGTGVMGASMCAHILKAASPHYPTTVYNRTASKAAPLQALGAVVVGSPEEVADASDLVFSIVGYPADVRSVYLGDGSGQRVGVLARLRPGAVIVDLTTSEPSLAVEIAKAAAAKGIAALDAPVSGGDVGARSGTLSIMVGCDDLAAFDAVLPLLQCMGKNINRCGEAGAGQHTKMVNQTLIASGMVGVCEGLLYASRAGLDLETTIRAVASGAAGSWSISNLGPRIVARNFDPGFFVEHFVGHRTRYTAR